MSKKDKEKDKRKKGEARRFPWNVEPPRPAAPAPAEAAPVTRRSSPLPEGDDEDFEPRIPPLRPVHIEPRGPEELMGDETHSDIAPIGPTEYAPFADGPITLPPETVAAQPDRSPPSVSDLEKQIRDLEARLDQMIGSRPAPAPPPASQEGTVPAPPSPPSVEAPSAEPPSARATARDLLPTDFYLRHWGRAGRRQRAEEVDAFGFDPAYEARFVPFLDFLYRTYFRVETEGASNIPAEGRPWPDRREPLGRPPALYDGLMLRTTLRHELAATTSDTPRELRWLAEDFVYYLPFVGTMMNRLGAVRACQENAERLLARGGLVAVFPEGAKGIGKLFRERYRLQRFGRGGFIRLCLRTGTPIVPSAIVGAEEASPMLYRLEYMAKTLGIPYLPVTPTFPALGPLGLLPAPTKWKVAFGEPLRFDHHGPEDADDDVLVGQLSERVRAAIQALLDRTLSARRSIWFG